MCIGFITNSINSALNSNYIKPYIAKLVKFQLNYSYKKGWPRVPKSSNLEYQFIRRIYAIKLLTELSNNKILINLDESAFNRSLRIEYYLLPRRISGSILNLNSLGRCSLVLAILSDRQWIDILKPNTVNGNDYAKILTLLCTLLTFRGISPEKDWIFTMDNASIHTCEITTEIMKKFKINIWYIPPYTPIYALVELVIKFIKAKIKVFGRQTQINYSKKEGQRLIVDALKFINSKAVINTWVAVIDVWKNEILSYVTEIESTKQKSLGDFNINSMISY